MNTYKYSYFLLLFLVIWSAPILGQYNNLWIPDTLSGTEFNLTIKDTFSQIKPGNQTITGGINAKFWGPTLIFNKGDEVHLNVRNKLNEATTIHWHGMHLPAVMDGGPHQMIPAGTLWQPYWKVSNNAATYWYHPHLHEMTMEHITKGIGGLIIVRDSIESSLALPRTYGIDDIPLVLTDRDINSSNQFDIVPYGDNMIVNGVLNPQYDIPAQIVRFRILDAAIERSYNLGFSDNRTFYVITSDGGLLNAPVPVTRYLLSAGERIEILIDCKGQEGKSIDLKAFNSTLANSIPGGEAFVNGPFGNALGKKDFNIVHFNIGTPKANAITTIPTKLTTNVFPLAASAKLTRTITLTDSSGVPGILGPNAFILGRKLFKIDYVNHKVPIDNIEIWELKSTSVFSHPFHIHDVEFFILTRNGVAPPLAEQGWKDVVLVNRNETVRFIAKFDDFADEIHPFMYHCHISLHEDEGMMGQFTVTPSFSATTTTTNVACFGEATGSISLIVGGGSPPYTYKWEDGSISKDRTNLSAGNYSVTVTDSANRTTNQIIQVYQPTNPLTATVTKSDINCFGDNNGTIKINPNGGTSGYTYLWNDGKISNQRSGLPAGTYTTTVTDAKQCTTIVTSIISQPNTALSVSATSTDVSCFGGNDGAIMINVVGGTPAYSYKWSGNFTGSSLNSLNPGTYNITVIDSKSCTSALVKTISQPAEITISASATDVKCYGENTGSIELTVSGGTGGFTYVWSDSSTENNISSLKIGTYTATITDANLCTKTFNQSIIEPEAIKLLAQSTASTDSNNNGTASATATGGTPPYSFEWSNGAMGNQVNGLSGGTYMVIITDAHNCTETISVVVDIINATGDQIPDENSFTISPNPANQRIFLTLLNTNISPYYITITNTNGKVMIMLPRPQLSTGIDISQYAAGTYFLQLTDDKTKKVITKKFIRQ